MRGRKLESSLPKVVQQVRKDTIIYTSVVITKIVHPYIMPWNVLTVNMNFLWILCSLLFIYQDYLKAFKNKDPRDPFHNHCPEVRDGAQILLSSKAMGL
jgi:hypothetical protein